MEHPPPPLSAAFPKAVHPPSLATQEPRDLLQQNGAATSTDAAARHKELDAEAKAAFAAGRHADAASLFGQLLQMSGAELHLVLCNRSAAWAKLGMWQEAEVDARDAQAAAPPGFLKAPYRLACALQGGGQLDEALTVCDGALALSPTNEQLLALRRSLAPAAEATRSTRGRPASEAAAAALVSAAAREERAEAAAEKDTEAEAEEELPLEGHSSYAAFCQATGNRLFKAGEWGQAVAWYTHAVEAVGEAAAPPPPSSDAPAAKVAEVA